jgi:uncharacterized Zn finger protein (UPF0148 family)
MSETGCPVCGYPKFIELHAEGSATYDICPCCGFESGVDGIGRDRNERNSTFRQRWIESGARWWSTAREPEPGWNALDQLRAAGLTETDPDTDPDDD